MTTSPRRTPSPTPSPTHRRTARVAGLVLGLVAMGGAASAATPDGASTTPAATATTATATASIVSTSSLLTLEDLVATGLPADSAAVDRRGDLLLGDAGRFDGCLGEKSIRNMTNAKSYPSRGTALAYVDGTFTSTLDKQVWLREAATQAPGPAAADHDVDNLRMELGFLYECQGSPVPKVAGYGPRQVFRAGAATVELYPDLVFPRVSATGVPTGGGSLIVRHGTRVAFVDLMGTPGRDLTVLRKVAVAAAARLG